MSLPSASAVPSFRKPRKACPERAQRVEWAGAAVFLPPRAEHKPGPAPGGNSVYRFSDTGLQHTRTMSGSVVCNVPPPYNQQLCNPINHTVKLSAGIGSKFGTVTQYSFSGPNSWSAQASVTMNDLFTCFEGGCGLGSTGAVICSEAGQIYTDSPPTIEYEWATTQVTWYSKDTPVCLGHFCRYKVSWSCTRNPPDYQIGTVQSGDAYYENKLTTVSWQSKAFCFRFFSGTPWSCFVPPVIGDPLTWVVALDSVPAPYDCTYNP